MQITDSDVIVVGAGVAGLSAATYLARAGRTVTVLEQAAGIGGRAASRTFDGYTFNHGIHALFTGGAASQVLAELGVTYRYGIPGTPVVLHAGQLAALPAKPLALLRNHLLGAGDKLALLALLARIQGMAAAELAQTSVADWLAATIRRPRLRKLFAALARTAVYTAALDLISAEVFVDKFQRGLRHPIHYIAGGWQTLVDALRAAAEQAGARIVTEVHVDAVAHAGRRAIGVRLRDGTLAPAGAIVVATDARDASRLIGRDLAPALHQAIAGRQPALLACLDVALRGLPNPTAPVVQDLDGPRFLSAQSHYTPVAPQGAALISTFKQLDPRQPSDPHDDEHDLEDLLDSTQPGWRDLLVRRAYLPRIEAVGWLPLAACGGFAGRPATQVAEAAGLFLAGDWVGPEGFLADASFASARAAARQLLASPPRAAGPRREVEAVY
jgi:phytoene dehydrogenase-like protein